MAILDVEEKWRPNPWVTKAGLLMHFIFPHVSQSDVEKLCPEPHILFLSIFLCYLFSRDKILVIETLDNSTHFVLLSCFHISLPCPVMGLDLSRFINNWCLEEDILTARFSETELEGVREQEIVVMYIWPLSFLFFSFVEEKPLDVSPCYVANSSPKSHLP